MALPSPPQRPSACSINVSSRHPSPCSGGKPQLRRPRSTVDALRSSASSLGAQGSPLFARTSQYRVSAGGYPRDRKLDHLFEAAIGAI
jgi:hypothetical protein